METSVTSGLSSNELQNKLNDITSVFLNHNNYASILVDGPAVLDKMYNLIENAEDYILLEEYIFRNDEVGKDFIKLLKKKANQGVEVYVILDGFGSFRDSLKIYCSLKEQNVNASIHNPLLNWTIIRINKRNHRKVLVVDGVHGVISGIGLGKEYRYWRDLGVYIKGESVADLEYSFWKGWKDSGWGFIHKSIPVPIVSRLKRRLDNIISPYEINNKMEINNEISYGNNSVRIVSSYPFISHYENFDNIIKIINNTNDYLYITNAYFVPNVLIRNALKDAVNRGVDVRIILPNETDLPFVRRASRTLYTSLLRNGIKLYELKGVILHAKYVVADDFYVSIGSTNLIDRSFFANFECNADIFDEDIALQMKNIFYEDLSNSIEITYDYWKNRSIIKKITQWLNVSTFWVF